MKKILVLTAALGVAVFLSAQNKMLQPDQLSSRALYPLPQMRNLGFAGNNQIAYINDTVLYMGPAGSKNVVLTLSRLNRILSSAGKEPLEYLPRMRFLNEREIEFTAHSELLRYNFRTRTLAKVDDVLQFNNLDIAPVTHLKAYAHNGSLCVTDGTTPIIVATNEDGIVYGESVHRNEFGITKGTFWSPMGNMLAFYRMDESMVADYPLVHTDRRIATAAPFKYPMAGMKSHEVTVGIYNSITQQTIYLNTRRDTTVAEREMYLTNISWSPDERFIYIAKVNREQNHLWLECYDAATGQRVRTLFEEHNDRYVEPLDGLHFRPGHDDEFFWLSRRDGYNHIYHYRTDGTLLSQLTSGPYEVSSIIGFDPKGKKLFFYSNREDPTGQYAYCINLASKQTTLMTPQPGTHRVTINNAGTLLIDTYSNTTTPSRTVLSTTEGREKRVLEEIPNPLAEYANPTLRIGTLKAADGTTDLYYRLITPPHMDSTRRYPTLIYVYGGPHSQLVTNEWLGGTGLYTYFLAQQGYVVFTLDNRGTSNRGFEFESCVHRNLGDIQLADQMEGVKYLQSLPFVDTNRMGVEGWSFGGFMTITMKLAHPEIFKVACAGGPVIDWKWYEIMYGERYMDTPQENPEGYATASLLSKADKLEGRLLVIHGAEDPVVMWQNSLEFIDACIKAGKQVDYFVYPDHQHNVLGRDRLHLYAKMFDYYETFLK